MVKVKMLQDTLGSDNGIKVSNYKAGKEYVIGESLCDSFIKMGFCELVLDEPKTISPVEEKKVVKPVKTKKVKTTKKKEDE